ncbi:MAG: hypothetical protein WBG92_00320 [Thiohalocapsa sp.]
MNEAVEHTNETPDWHSRLRALLRPINAWLPWRVLLLMAVLAVLLHMFGVISLPLWPFTTVGGSIHVDSPEVYTRERLVNDRYEQDYWLREQLRLLNEVTPEDLATGRLFTGTRTEIGDAPAADADGAGPAGAEAVDELDFRSRYEVLSGIRDMLRQQILENMLDDRHDLTANSVYGLKFDTTVIPGRNTRNRAFVEVELKPVDLFLSDKGVDECVAEGVEGDANDGIADTGPLNGLVPFQRAYVCKRAQVAGRTLDGCGDIGGVLADYDDQRELYRAWLQDIEKRLNAAEESLFEVIAAQDPDCGAVPLGIMSARYQELIGRSLEVVLNLPQKRFLIDHYGLLEQPAKPALGATLGYGDTGTAGENGGADAPSAPEGSMIRLPEPYSDYMRIEAKPIWIPNGGSCSLRVALDVQPVREQYLVHRPVAPATPRVCVTVADTEFLCSADANSFGNLLARAQPLHGWLSLKTLPCDPSQLPFSFWTTEQGGWELLMDAVAWQFRQSVASDFGVVYEAPDVLFEVMTSDGLAPVEDLANCSLVEPAYFRIDLPSGFFNFIESMGELDAYAYAVFPKNDVRGELRQTRSAGGIGGAGGGLGFLRGLTESRTEPLLVGYGDSREDCDGLRKRRSVGFGWVIASPERMEPSLKTQLALVSVPAWTDRLHVDLTTGWLDRSGRRSQVHKKASMEVKLPPDFGAFDSIFRDQGWVTPAPQIRDQDMDRAIYVVAGQDASILIPGLRLWRSTSATLGSQTADRIRVLPNMEGIIADFRPVHLPFAKYRARPTRDDDADVDGRVASSAAPPRCTLQEVQMDGTLGAVPSAYVGLQVRPVRLRVWTSEGVAVASQPACVIYDPRRQVREAMAKPEQGTPIRDASAAPVGPLDATESMPIEEAAPSE